MPVIDEHRSPLQTADDIRRARERVFDALLTWWTQPPISDTPDDGLSRALNDGESALARGEVAKILRGVLRDAETAADYHARQARRRTTRSRGRLPQPLTAEQLQRVRARTKRT